MSSPAALPETNPIYGPFFGVMGAASAIIFSGKYWEIQPKTSREKKIRIHTSTQELEIVIDRSPKLKRKKKKEYEERRAGASSRFSYIWKKWDSFFAQYISQCQKTKMKINREAENKTGNERQEKSWEAKKNWLWKIPCLLSHTILYGIHAAP